MSKIEKLGVGIIAFEGLEHIKNIAYEIKSECDEIVLCLQHTSYHGDPIEESDVAAAEELKALGYVDSIIWFEPTELYVNEGPNGPRLIETDKRNFILDYLQNTCGCSHAMVIDSDEFYDHYDFIKAKDMISSDENIHVTYCQYINYYRDYRHLLVWPFFTYVPFISEAKYRFDFKNGSFAKPSDPTRRYRLDQGMTVYHTLPYNVVKMHHLSWIRLDIKKKVDSWSAKKIFDNVPGLRERVIDSYNNYIEGDNATVMFNVPFNKVCVTCLPKIYIKPKFHIYETPCKYNGYEK